MEPKENEQRKWQKYQLILALIVTALLAVIVGTQAWLNNTRKLQTAAVVDMPTLIIQGPKDSDTAPIELGDIDVTKDRHSRYVFCITSISAQEYKLQFAHTTNLPFTYTIYKTGVDKAGPVSVRVGDHSYGYDETTDMVSGAYLNLPANGTVPGIAGTSLHGQTYGTYAKVHENAEPLYWQSINIELDKDGESVDGVRRDFYVLDVSWGEGLSNNKETDMVYLTVELVKQ